MITREMISDAWMRKSIVIADSTDRSEARILIYGNSIPLIKPDETPVTMLADDYIANTTGDEIISDIEASLKAANQNYFERILNGEDRFELPYVRYTPVLAAAEQTFGVDTQIDRVLEEMSELSQALLKYRRFAANCSEEKRQNLVHNLNEEIGDVLSTVTHIIIMYGDKDAIQLSMDHKLARLAHRIRTKTAETNFGKIEKKPENNVNRV